jgi:hypothetical protein
MFNAMLLKAGTSRYQATGTSSSCGTCESGTCPDKLALPMPWTLNIHEWPSVRAALSIPFAPAQTSTQRECVAAAETVVVNAGTPQEFKTVPAGYAFPLAYAPAVSIVEGVSFGATYEVLARGNESQGIFGAPTAVDTSMQGLVIAIEAYEVDPCACTEIDDIADLTLIPTATPAVVANINVHDLAISCTKGVIGKPSPATGGYVANTHGVLYVARVVAAPTNVPLSKITGAFGLQINVQTAEATPRLFDAMRGTFGQG